MIRSLFIFKKFQSLMVYGVAVGPCKFKNRIHINMSSLTQVNRIWIRGRIQHKFQKGVAFRFSLLIEQFSKKMIVGREEKPPIEEILALSLERGTEVKKVF